MAFDQATYERLALEEGPDVALKAAIQDVEKLKDYMSAHYTGATLIDEISKLRGLLRRCRSLLQAVDNGAVVWNPVHTLIAEIEEAL